MKNRKWVKPVIFIVVFAAITAGIWLGVQSLLGGRGVAASKDDIIAVVKSVLPYLIVMAVAVLAIAAAFIVCAVKKPSAAAKLTIRTQTVAAGLLAIVVCVNLICVGPMSSLLNVSAGAKGAMSETTQERSRALAEQIAEEGIVLLKNKDGALPLGADVTKLNVFGWASTNPIYGGTGSGEFSSAADKVTLLQGLELAGYELNQDLINFYVKEESERPEVGMYIQDWTNPEAKIKDMDRAKLFDGAKEFSDTALLVISRSGGEGADLPGSITDENSIAEAAATGRGVRYTSQKDDVDPEKSYLELTSRETALLERLNEEFKNIIVIINSANTMELGWIEEYENIGGVIWCAGPGEFGFAALGRVLNGSVSPSGRTADTYLYDLTTAPTYRNFGNFEYDNVSELVNRPGSGDNYKATFVNYVEGIYVGYKFYETAAAEGLIDYEKTVQFPFGFGLSYASFQQELTELAEKDGAVTLKVKVTNVGSTAGKDVVEVYYTPPYTNGGIEKSSVNLIEFAKTETLEPGQSETVEVSFALEDMASYDDLNRGCYVLEAGDYEISIRSDSHTVLAAQTVHVDADVVYNDSGAGARPSDAIAAVNRFDFARGDVTYLSRADGFANYAQATAAPASMSMSGEAKAGFISNAVYDPAEHMDNSGTVPAAGASNGLTLEDMAGAEYSDKRWDALLDQLTAADMNALISVGGYMTSEIPSVGFQATVETDGPSGLHSNYTDLAGISFPAPVMLASTWNKELAREFGEVVGLEGQELGISGWYGPAMNIHRSAFSGRNFEYYSEDAVLSGVIAANAVAGARVHNMQTYVKHFALNDQEGNRTNMLLTWSNEQAIREIYLKPFEMALKEGGAKSVMSSYNYIGNIWAGACDALLNQVLRGEWGIDCTVVTDWYGGYGYMNADLSIRNGGDRMLTTTDTAKLLDSDSAEARTAMRRACHNILYSLANSNVFGSNLGMANWRIILIAADICAGVLLVILEAVYFLRLKKAKQNGPDPSK